MLTKIHSCMCSQSVKCGSERMMVVDEVSVSILEIPILDIVSSYTNISSIYSIVSLLLAPGSDRGGK